MKKRRTREELPDEVLGAGVRLLKDGYEEIDAGRVPDERCPECGAKSLRYVTFWHEDEDPVAITYCRKRSCGHVSAT